MFVKRKNMTEEVRRMVEFYYLEKGEEPLFPQNVFGYMYDLLTATENQVIVLNNRLVCGGTRHLFNKRCDLWDTVTEFSAQYMALKEAITILNRRGVACFFFNRPGVKAGFEYSDDAVYRMKKRLSFPKMLQNIEKYEKHWRQLLGEQYSVEYVKKLSQISQIIKKDNFYVHEDIQSDVVNVRNGKRLTVGQPLSAKNHIYVYGRCGAFGYAVEDDENIPSYLQKCFVDDGMEDYAVVNQGLWGAKDNNIIHNFLLNVSEFREGDIVIFYLKHFDFAILKQLEQNGLWFDNLTEKWHEFPEAKWCFYDKPGHMNNMGYKNVASLIFEYMKSKQFLPRPINDSEELSASYLNEYIKKVRDIEFERNINKYIESIKADVPPEFVNANCGAIVMNCNPFTRGHRYLIETACDSVDYLYIFVVEEDRSFFKFEDRFQMVKNGTSDLKNVFVVPSGKFIISALTFPEYFLKDYVKEKNFDVSNDVEIFCKYIAPALNIKKRFVGEEPFDPVTDNYNSEMKRLLPQYGMELVEIARFSSEAGSVINATKVRADLKSGLLDEVKQFVPDSTLKILQEKYME